MGRVILAPEHGRTQRDIEVVRPSRRRTRRLQPRGFQLILPGFVLSVGLIYYCVGYTAYISTLNWDGLGPNPQHVGFKNYTQLFQDPTFWRALEHTLVFFVITFVMQTVLGLVSAVLLHSRVRLPTLYKVIIFTPVVIAPAVMAPAFRELFATTGQLNWILEHLGLGGLTHSWLADPSTVLFVVICVSIWEWTGMSFILLYAALSQVDPDIIEAARLDGAGNVRVLRSIIVPYVRGTIVALATLNAIGSMKTFDVPYLVTLTGPNYATEFLGTFIYRQTVVLGAVGYGAAASIVLLVLAIALALFLSLRGRVKRPEDGSA